MTFRVAQVSDSHLSRDKPFFVENFHVVAAALAASAPDLVVNTGDVSSDGATVEADLAEARPARGEGMRCVRAPSTGFIIPDARQPVYGEKEVGDVEHRFERDGGCSSAFVRVEGLERLDISDFAAAYGKAT
jgi:3',5'-cyclic AMP phosphodiesterase CpdA